MIKGMLKRLVAFLRLNSLWVMVSAATMVISITGIVMVTILINDRFDDLIDQTTQQNSRQIVESAAASIDSYLYGMLTTVDSIEGLLRRKGTISSEKLNDIFTHKDINTIVILDRDGNVVADYRDSKLTEGIKFKQQEWFVSAMDKIDNYSIGVPKVQRIYEGEYPWIISLSKAITVDSNADSPLVILLDLNFNTIRDLCSLELGTSGYLYILGPDMQIIYHPYQQIIYAGIAMDDLQSVAGLEDGDTIIESAGKRISVSTRTLNTTGWQIIGVSPLIGFFSYDNEINNYINIIIIITIFMTIASAMIVSLMLTRPIRNLIMMMRHVESGGFDMVYQIKGAFEVRELSSSFTRMVHQIKNLMEDLRNEQEQILKDQAQLSAIEMKFLHAQLNPHFLYNTLDSVVWLAESGNQKSVVKMTEALSNYFRLSLSGGDDVITLENELKHTENYLIIQKMRYNEQFDYSIKNELMSSEYMTIKNIIQPIVENSIVHGVANMLEQCYISVRAYAEDQKLIIKVKDNGSGISPAALKKILDPKPGSKSGIGIYNVNKRIQLMYGNEYGLKYESEPDEGTTVYIILPLETKA